MLQGLCILCLMFKKISVIYIFTDIVNNYSKI